jgi:hypothetical protein
MIQNNVYKTYVYIIMFYNICTIIFNNSDLYNENKELKLKLDIMLDYEQEVKPIADKILFKYNKLYKKYGINSKDMDFAFALYENIDVIPKSIKYNEKEITVFNTLGKINCILELINEHKEELEYEIKEKLGKIKGPKLVIYALDDLNIPENQIITYEEN